MLRDCLGRMSEVKEGDKQKHTSGFTCHSSESSYFSRTVNKSIWELTLLAMISVELSAYDESDGR